MNQKERLTEELKQRWMSAYEMQQFLKSSSADRIMRTIRENPPAGWLIVDRPKKIERYTPCLEYKLVQEARQYSLF